MSGGKGGINPFLRNGERADGQWPEGTEHLNPYSCRRLLHQVEGRVVAQALPFSPGLRHCGEVRVRELSNPAGLRLETQIRLVREHHGEIGRAVLKRALDGNGISYSAVGEGMAIDVIEPSCRQGHGGGGAESGEDPLIPGFEIDGFARMAVGQQDEEARRSHLQGFDRQGNMLSEDVIHQVRQINDRFVAEEIDLAHDFAGLFAPDGQARTPHSRDKISRRAGAR